MVLPEEIATAAGRGQLDAVRNWLDENSAHDVHGVWFTKTSVFGDKSLVLVRPDAHVACITSDPHEIGDALCDASHSS